MPKHEEKPLYYVITHDDVDGHNCLDFILKLVGEAKVIFKRRNKLCSKELLLLFDPEPLSTRDFVFLVECTPTNKAVEKIVELSERVRRIFFFHHYACLEKDHFDVLYRHTYSLFSGCHDYPTETVVRNFYSLFRKAGFVGQDFSKAFKVMEKELETLREKNFVVKQQRCKKNPKRKFYIRGDPKDHHIDPEDDSVVEKRFKSHPLHFLMNRHKKISTPLWSDFSIDSNQDIHLE